jgi:hypothetical protein
MVAALDRHVNRCAAFDHTDQSAQANCKRLYACFLHQRAPDDCQLARLSKHTVLGLGDL